MHAQRIVKFWRFTSQGLAIATWGTMGLTPAWGSFILGVAGGICPVAL